MIRVTALVLVVAACGSAPLAHEVPPTKPVSPVSSYAASVDAAALAAAEQAWAAARACLITSPLGDRADVRDALAAQQPTLPDCTTTIARVRWPTAAGAAAEISQDLDDATRSLAALAVPRLADDERLGDEAATRAAAIRDVDDARVAAGLPLAASTPLPDVVPLAGPPALAHAGLPPPDMPIGFRVGFSFVDHVVTIEAGRETIVARGPHAIAALPTGFALSRDGSWGWAFDPDRSVVGGPVVVGTFDGHAIVDPVTITTGGYPVAFAGSGATRVVLVSYEDRYDVELSRDGGKTWRVAGTLPTAANITRGTSDTIDVFTGNRRDATWIRVARDGTIAAPRPVPDIEPGSSEACLADVVWWGVKSELHWDTGTRTGKMPMPGPLQIVTCADNTVVAKTKDQLYRCTPAGCDAGTPIVGRNDPWLPIDFVANGFVYAIQFGRVVEVQRTGARPRFARLASDEALVGLVTWDDTPYLVTTSTHGARIDALP